MMTQKYLIALAIFVIPGVAHAYVGPGLGAGAIAVALGIIGSILLAIGAVVYYPVKRVLRKRKASSEQSSPTKPEQ